MKTTPSALALEMGLPSLKYVTDVTGKSKQTLLNWHNDQPDLFEVVLLGAKAKLESAHAV